MTDSSTPQFSAKPTVKFSDKFSEKSLTQKKQFVLIGAPNSGKTTLYNWLTGSKFRTVNYPGATVEYCEGTTLSLYSQTQETWKVFDTPGLRSLQALSEDEKIAIQTIVDQSIQQPTILVVVIDVTQVSRQLFLLEQVRELGISFVVALTMTDLAEKRDWKINLEAMQANLQVPVVPIIGLLGGGVKELLQALEKAPAVIGKNVKLPNWSQKKIEQVYREGDQKLKNWIQNYLSAADPTTLKMDRWLLHPVLGLAIFFLIMSALFASIFWLAKPFMNGVDQFFSWLSQLVATHLTAGGLFTDFLSSGVITGLGAFMVFVPQILILFLLMGFLEDSGYLARAAALIDKPLSKIGLNGRSFVPLLSGYACAIPGMMSARTIASRKERLLTIFILPLMSCSARLPVYVLLLGFLFPSSSSWLAGIWMAVIYLGSMVIGAVVAAIAAKFIHTTEKSWLLLELPAYRTPKWRVTAVTAWQRTQNFILRAGPTIFVVTIVIWVATTFPNYQIADASERLSGSFATMLGQWMQPFWQPMGLDWRVGVAILSAFAAREVFVATLALIYHVTAGEEQLTQTLIETMQKAKLPNGQLVFTTASVIGLIVFFMIALQCLSTVVVSRRESGSWRFTLIQLATYTGGAYLLSVAIVQLLRAVGVS